MAAAASSAGFLIGKVLGKLSDDLVKGYVASSELGLNSEQIKTKLMYTQELLQLAQEKDLSNHPGLRGLLEQLSRSADEAEDVLDELQYFMIQDQLDGTSYAVPDLGGLKGKTQHSRNAVRHSIGNCFPCFSSSCTKNNDSGNGSHADRLVFDRVAMSIKIKSVMEDMHSKCIDISDLLKIPNHSRAGTTAFSLARPLIGSMIVQDKMYGRNDIFEQAIHDIVDGKYGTETLSVLPIVGPGGIGKTTFTQHLYNDKMTEQHFSVRVWVCVSTDFDVLKLTEQIHNCIPASEEENIDTTNLDQLQISIAKRLKSERFLIVLDDIWKCDSEGEWETALAPFTKGEAKGSMVLVTTRFPNIAERVKKATKPINLSGLEPEEFWEFFLTCVFGGNKPDQLCNELIDTGREIAKKLKCSPLAAKTVGRLLKKELSWEHWRKVLENNEWTNQTSNDDIMTALKISYDYLPFHLKQCFPYCALFPEDYRFNSLEIACFWTALGIIDSCCENGTNYLEELVDNGFLMKGCDNFENHYYVMHDLMHELSRSVSSQECHNISSSSFSADDIQQSIRHISITMENRYDDTIIEEMAKLKSRIDIGNLRTLMIFRNYEGKTARILEDTFKEIKCVRVLFINIYSLESLPLNFSKLIHLQYLKFGSLRCLGINLASALSKLYNLKFLDLQDCFNRFKLPKDINRLVNLRHFIAHSEHHSRVPEVGKMKHLHELKQFYVRRRSVGFGLEELGRLKNLGGELSIHNLERVATKEEAIEAKLSMKRNLRELALVWSKNQPSIDANILDDSLKPHNNLRGLTIKGHGGAIGPSWLCGEISIKHLEFLTLEGVSWVTLPSFSQLTYLKVLRLKTIAGVRVVGPDFGTDRGKSFMHLKEVVFLDMPDLEKWVVEPNCHLFPMLGSITCVRCPNFHALPFFSEYSGPSTQDIAYPSLCSLYIKDCPKLSLPPMPHTSTLTSVDMHDTTGHMSYQKTKLILRSYRGALALHNLAKLESITISGGATIAWTDLQMLTSLLRLEVKECDSMLPSKLVALTGIARESTMQSMAMISNPMSLTCLDLVDCKNLNVDGFSPLITVNLKELMVCNRKNSSRSIAEDLLSEVARTKSMLPAGSFQLETLTVDCISVVLVAPICSLVASTLQKLAIRYDQRAESFTEEEEKALQLLTSLQRLQFDDCPCLPSLPQGLHGLSSLRKLKVRDCPEIRSLPKHGLPTSLEKLNVDYCSAELQDQIEELKRTNGNLRVYA